MMAGLYSLLPLFSAYQSSSICHLLRYRTVRLSMKNKIIIVLSLLLMIVSGYFGREWVIKTNNTQAKIQNSHLKPIIFIPGSSATIDRFDSLIATLNSKGTKHSVLKVQVNTDGHLTYSGRIRANDQQPFIIIGFQNNNEDRKSTRLNSSHHSIS